MAFGKITKEDLVAAGLDPDKLKDFQEKGVTKDDLATLKTELATSVTDLIKAQFSELETRLRPVPKTTTESEDGNKNQKTQEELEEERNAEFLQNPTKYVSGEVNKLGIAAQVEFKKMSRDLAYKDAKTSFRGFRNAEIAKEIDEEWAKYTPEKMAQFNTDPSLLVKQIHDMVMGRHFDEIQRDADKKDGKYNFVHSGGSGGGNSVLNDVNNNRNTNAPVVTPEISAQAAKFGMTGEEWLKEQDDMQKEESTRFVKAGV